MARSFLVDRLLPGTVSLDDRQSRHARDVLRLQPGDAVTLFDAAGHSSSGKIISLAPLVTVELSGPIQSRAKSVSLVVAAATPKGPRADWMIEKLSELGTDQFIPLLTDRTIVRPESGKLERWRRLAEESAKQCRRGDLMQISPPQQLEAISSIAADARWCLSTAADACPVMPMLPALKGQTLLALVGPEGGWSERELKSLVDSGFRSVALTRTILRIETAAIAIASLVMTAAVEEKE